MPKYIETDDYDEECDDPGGGGEGDDTLPCPYCGVEIYEDAEVCPYCGSYIIEQERTPKPRDNAAQALNRLLAILTTVAANPQLNKGLKISIGRERAQGQLSLRFSLKKTIMTTSTLLG